MPSFRKVAELFCVLFRNKKLFSPPQSAKHREGWGPFLLRLHLAAVREITYATILRKKKIFLVFQFRNFFKHWSLGWLIWPEWKNKSSVMTSVILELIVQRRPRSTKKGKFKSKPISPLNQDKATMASLMACQRTREDHLSPGSINSIFFKRYTATSGPGCSSVKESKHALACLCMLQKNLDLFFKAGMTLD